MGGIALFGAVGSGFHMFHGMGMFYRRESLNFCFSAFGTGSLLDTCTGFGGFGTDKPAAPIMSQIRQNCCIGFPTGTGISFFAVSLTGSSLCDAGSVVVGVR